MIDFEKEIYTPIAQGLRNAFPGITVSGMDIITKPASFPAVSIVEADNFSVVSTQDSSSIENHAELMYEITVYAHGKSEAKSVLSHIDSKLMALNFTRTMSNPFVFQNGNEYRIIARYSAVISKDGILYGR